MPHANGEPSSWAEAINMYAREKSVRPRPDSEYAKPPRVTRYEKSREEVEYHPILQTFRNTERETSARTFEDASRVQQLNAARDRQIATESPFDILNMSDKRSALPRPPAPQAEAMVAPFNPHAERPTFRHPLDSCYQFNIVSNLPLSQHHYSAPKLRPNVSEEVAVTKPRLQHLAALPRDFNILSNRYVESHDEKVQLEREIQRRAAAAKYWETHDYEPLIGKFVHPEKEAAYTEFLETELSKQPLKSFNRLPPSLQKGEGFVYDITTHQVKNEALYEAEQEKEHAKRQRDASTWERAENQRNTGLQRQVLSDARSINRQSHQRYVDTFRHGYNIVDHRDFRDPQTYMPPPRTRPQPTLWQAVGPDRMPPPPPLPGPPPAIAPLLSTVPSGFAASISGKFQGSNFSSTSAPPPSAPPPAAPAAAPARTGGISMLAEYEARGGAPAPAPM